MAQKYVELNELMQIIQEKLDCNGNVIFTPFGVSMLPLLKNGKSIVKLEKLNRKLKRNDLPLYKREDGKYILHRVVKVNKNNTFNARGDNQIVTEKNININQIIAVVVSYKRKKKEKSIDSFSYHLYSFIWNIIFPIRWILRKFKNQLLKIKKKIAKQS